MQSKFNINLKFVQSINAFVEKNAVYLIVMALSAISVFSYLYYLQNGLGLSYNDARSHLDIGRRVVEGLKPGLAQIGSVWLPLPHLLMIPTIWSDFFWHTGLSGAIQSMASFVATGILIYLFLKQLGVTLLGRIVGVAVFALNLNILYLQSTAMTELLLIATMTAAAYQLFIWQKYSKIIDLIYSAFFVMMATLVRYDGWFLFVWAAAIVGILSFFKKGRKAVEGTTIFYSTLAGFGIFLWFLWNLLIFKDPLYFAFGEYSAHAQQQQLAAAGVLATENNLALSTKVYLYSLFYNSYTLHLLLATLGACVFLLDRKIKENTKIAVSALFAPLVFNILALFLGFSVLFVQGISGNTWFNVRYGVMLAPTIAIFAGYLIYRSGNLKWLFIGLLFMVTTFSFLNHDAVTIDDATVGSSQKNVSEVSGWIKNNAKDKEGFVLISAASHDAIIFSSSLPMSKFIHEGTGNYWTAATSSPERWARFIIMRTHDNNDLTFKLIKDRPGLAKYRLVGHYPFADIYELKEEYVGSLITTPIFGKQK